MRWVLLLVLASSMQATYEVGRWRVGRNCARKDDVTHPNTKRVAVEFLNPAFDTGPAPVVVASITKPSHYKAKDHAFVVNVLTVDRAGFVAEVSRMDRPVRGAVDSGWCYDDLDVAWMAYAPTANTPLTTPP